MIDLGKLDAPLTEQQMDAIAFVHVEDPEDRAQKYLCAIPVQKVAPHLQKLIPICSEIPDKIKYLVEAAPFMFQILGKMLVESERLINTMEVVNVETKKHYGKVAPLGDGIVQFAVKLQNDAMLARRLATVGKEKVYAEMVADDVDKSKR